MLNTKLEPWSMFSSSSSCIAWNVRCEVRANGTSVSKSESSWLFPPWSYCRPGYIFPSPSAAPGWSGALPGDWRCCRDTVPRHTGPLHCHLWGKGRQTSGDFNNDAKRIHEPYKGMDLKKQHLIPECHSSFSWLLLLWSSSAGLPLEQSSSSASSSSPSSSSSSSSSASSSSSTTMLLLSWSISVARLLKSSWPSGGFPLKSPALTSGVHPISSPSSCSRRSMEAWMFRRSSYSDTLGKREYGYRTLCTRVGGKSRDYKTISHSALWLQGMFILLFVLWLFFIFRCLIQVLNLQVVVLGGIGVCHCRALLRTEEPAKVWQGARPEHLRVRSKQRM